MDVNGFRLPIDTYNHLNPFVYIVLLSKIYLRPEERLRDAQQLIPCHYTNSCII